MTGLGLTSNQIAELQKEKQVADTMHYQMKEMFSH